MSACDLFENFDFSKRMVFTGHFSTNVSSDTLLYKHDIENAFKLPCSLYSMKKIGENTTLKRSRLFMKCVARKERQDEGFVKSSINAKRHEIEL